MNYTKLYNNIIKNAISNNRKKSKEIYYEKHHIFPECLGGTNDNSNLVFLTAKEHFVCHHLLTKIYNNDKLHFAFWAMCHQVEGDVSRYYKITHRQYQTAKINFSKANSKLHKNKKLSKEHIEAIKRYMLGNTIHKKGKESHLFGISRTEEVKRKISDTKRKHPEKNPSYRGNYITPNGTFKTSKEAEIANKLSEDVIRSRCKNCETIITPRHIVNNTDLTSDNLGKTFKQLGYSFSPV